MITLIYYAVKAIKLQGIILYFLRKCKLLHYFFNLVLTNYSKTQNKALRVP